MNKYLRKKLTDVVGDNPSSVSFKRPPAPKYILDKIDKLLSIKLPS